MLDYSILDFEAEKPPSRIGVAHTILDVRPNPLIQPASLLKQSSETAAEWHSLTGRPQRRQAAPKQNKSLEKLTEVADVVRIAIENMLNISNSATDATITATWRCLNESVATASASPSLR